MGGGALGVELRVWGFGRRISDSGSRGFSI